MSNAEVHLAEYLRAKRVILEQGQKIERLRDKLANAVMERDYAIAERDEYKCEMESAFKLTQKQAKILTDTINALKGDPPELTSWSHHDVAEHARRAVAENEKLATTVRDLQIELMDGPWDGDSDES
jgi:hypothetical protein